VSLVVLTAVIGGCAPQNATITAGEYTAFLAISNSITYQRGDLKLDQFDRQYYVDCREFFDATVKETEDFRLGEGTGEQGDVRLPICTGDPGVGGNWPPTQETWMDDDGFLVVGSELDPWRGEAVITSEGDVQISFHQPLPGARDDLRFAIAIDPDFQPRQCVQNESGDGVEYKEIDGDWVAGWSGDIKEGEGGGRLFYLNALAYQFAPRETIEHNLDPATADLRRWNIPDEWQGGYSEAKFSDDRLFMRSARYGDPASYLTYETASNSLGGLDLLPDVFTGDIYYCQSWREEYNRCLEPARLQTYSACIAAATDQLGRDQCGISFSECLEDEEAGFSGDRLGEDGDILIGIGIPFYGFGSFTRSGLVVSGYELCTIEYAACANEATLDGESTAPCEAEFATCHEEAYQACKTSTDDVATSASRQIRNELARAGVPGAEEPEEGETAGALQTLQPRYHKNEWRTPDGFAAGIDDWSELNFNWIRFDEGSELEVGGSASGTFQLVYDAIDSASRLFIRGSFEVKKFKKDTWTTKNLPPIKFEENGTTECGTLPEN
jgi:hypothetical protein